MAARLRTHKLSKWATIPAPPPGARYRGYLRYSERDHHTAAADKSTFQMQRGEIDAFAQKFGWMCAGWDEEPAVSGAAEEISQRPAFQKHLADAAAGLFDVSLCFMSDRWARDTAIGLDISNGCGVLASTGLPPMAAGISTRSSRTALASPSWSIPKSTRSMRGSPVRKRSSRGAYVRMLVTTMGV